MLKDVINDDLTDVFMDIDDFADIHTISNLDGSKKSECLMVKEGQISKELKDKLNAKYNIFNGIWGDTCIVHVKTSDLFEVPVEDQQIRFDDQIYEVASSEENMGMVTLLLTTLRAL